MVVTKGSFTVLRKCSDEPAYEENLLTKYILNIFVSQPIFFLVNCTLFAILFLGSHNQEIISVPSYHCYSRCVD